jgi:thiol:disulfide interchange protein DsbD
MTSRARFQTLALTLIVLGLSVPARAAGAPAADADAFSQALAKGPIYAALATFVSGFLVSLTPCVYPMVAVTVSVFGAREAKGRLSGALLSATFVAGIVVMFAGLGVVAALTGGVFGSALSNTWVVVGISLLFVVMALSMFGAFELDIPQSLKNRLATVGGTGYAGSFVLGLACGPIAAPCTGPFLTGILAWIAKEQSLFLGVLTMVTFALGLGVPFFLVGTFAVQLPKSGRWMLYVKSLLGIILCVVALYFLANVFPVMSQLAKPTPTFIGISVAALVLGLAAGAVHRSFEDPSWGNRIAKGSGILLTVGASFLIIVALIKPARTLSWEADEQGQIGSAAHALQVRTRAASEARPLLMDFTASWCAACKEIEKLTFSDPRVKEEAGRFLAVKVDATNDEDPAVEATMRSLGVVGLPTVILFDQQGKEAQRFTDFVDAERFLSALERVK